MTPLEPNDLVAGPGQHTVESAPIELGRLAFEIDPEGGLRSVHLDGLEVIRRLYVAVRDVAWDTIAGVVADTDLTRAGDRLTYTFTSTHAGGGIEYTWRGRIEASADGAVRYEMDGRAGNAFDYARIGLLLLTPGQLAGRPYRVRTPAGLHGSLLPQTEIGPQAYIDGEYYALSPAFSELSLFPASGELRFALEGDLFEIEDQRNWTDDSFKTYSTPMALGVRHADAGGGIRQRLEMTPPPAAAGAPRRVPASGEVTLRVAGPPATRMPAIGLRHTFTDRPLSERERTLLRELAPDHVRVDLDAGRGTVAAEVAAASALAESLDCGLELAVHLEAGDEDGQLDAIAAAVADARPRRVLLLHGGELVTGARWTRALRDRLGGLVPVYGGTDLHFAEVNRERPDPAAADGVAFSINPQVHAFDDRSLMETAAVQGDVIRSARCTFAEATPLAVSPVTLKMRFNPDAAAPAGGAGGLPAAVDPRQSSLLCAAWTAASVKYLAEAGAETVTYFGTVGWEGVIERDEGSPLPRAFPSIPAGVYPCYHVLRTVARHRGAPVLPMTSSDRQRVAALGIGADAGDEVVIANLTAAALRVRLEGAGGAATATRLDATTVITALTDPGPFTAHPEPLDTSRPFELLPYAVWVVHGARLSGS